MAAPKHTIKSSQIDESSGLGISQSSPGWCLAFVRFKDPSCGYTKKEELLSYKDILIVEDDAVSVTVSNSKNSYLKSCNITLKSGDVYYPNAVSPGDWVVVWMHEDQSKINQIVSELKKIKLNKKTEASILNDWDSGLKFIGRVTSVTASDSVSSRGVRYITQSISASAFLELSSSVYFTVANYSLFSFLDPSNSSTGNDLTFTALKNLPRFKDFQSVFNDFFDGIKTTKDTVVSGRTPDQTILFLIIYLLGINENNALPSTGYEYARGNFNDAILVPDFISSVCNIPKNKETKIWQLYNVYSGLQKYSNNKKTIWSNFTPDLKIKDDGLSKNKIIFETGTRLKGFVPVTSPDFSNVSFWQIFNQYLNPLINEIYTCLKVDQFNRIKPTIIIREQPFGTGLFDNLITSDNKLKELQKESAQKNKNINTKKDSNLPKEPKIVAVNPAETNKNFYKNLTPELKERAMFGHLPRWAIDESVLLGFSMTTSEANRVNFVQVWGETINSYNSMLGGETDEKIANQEQNSLELLKQAQLTLGNYIIDNNDISRNGLRASVFNTDFDLKAGVGNKDNVGVTLAPLWAKMKADHLFNGHLKPTASIECVGISAPIVEGDNLEIRNIVFHIESVTHSASISPNGNKIFRTSILADNGIMAYSLEKDTSIPVYPLLAYDGNIDNQNAPGLTDFEAQRD